MHWATLIFPAVALAATPDFQPPDFRVERQPVANGAELLTVFSSLPGGDVGYPGEIPLVSVLRDTLRDMQLLRSEGRLEVDFDGHVPRFGVGRGRTDRM